MQHLAWPCGKDSGHAVHLTPLPGRDAALVVLCSGLMTLKPAHDLVPIHPGGEEVSQVTGCALVCAESLSQQWHAVHSCVARVLLTWLVGPEACPPPRASVGVRGPLATSSLKTPCPDATGAALSCRDLWKAGCESQVSVSPPRRKVRCGSESHWCHSSLAGDCPGWGLC